MNCACHDDRARIVAILASRHSTNVIKERRRGQLALSSSPRDCMAWHESRRCADAGTGRGNDAAVQRCSAFRHRKEQAAGKELLCAGRQPCRTRRRKAVWTGVRFPPPPPHGDGSRQRHVAAARRHLPGVPWFRQAARVAGDTTRQASDANSAKLDKRK